MKGLFAILLLAVAVTGCASKPKSQRAQEKAFMDGQQRMLIEQEQKEPAVWFRGDVRRQRVPWTEGLTLAEALASAQYVGSWDPHLITVTRAGELYSVNPKRLIRGQDNPVLEPGDIVEVRH